MKSISIWLRRRRWPLICCGGVLLVFIAVCAFLRISNLSDVQAYYGMVKNYHPIVRDLAFRHFDEGDPMSDLLQRYPTNGTTTFGHFSIFYDNYWASSSNRTSFEVFAKDGKMILAVADGLVDGVPWDFRFFHTTNDAEMLHQFDSETVEWDKQWRQKLSDAANDRKP